MPRIMTMLLLSLLSLTAGAREKIVTIGDSLTEEYEFEVPFSGPAPTASNPTPSANTKNWVETLANKRADDVKFGDYDSGYFHYYDLRNSGYEFNFGVPGHTAADWVKILSNDPGTVINSYTKENLQTLVRDTASVVVIFIGGNDLDNDYGAISGNPSPPASLAAIRDNIANIHDRVRAMKAGVPIIICTVPDVGASEAVAQTLTPAEKATGRARTAALNAEIISMAAAKGATIARIDRITDRVYDQIPFHLNGTEFFFPPDAQNEKHHLFCRDGFHPGAALQALIANEILSAINQARSTSIPLLSNREILSSVLSFNPDQPYLTWAGSSGAMTADPDGDGLPNLAEYLVGTQPGKADSPFTFGIAGEMKFTPQESALRFASLDIQESTTLAMDGWSMVPITRITTGGGQWTVAPSGQPHTFYRLSVEAKP